MIWFIFGNQIPFLNKLPPILSRLYTFHYTVLVTVNVVHVTFKCSTLLYVGYSPTDFLETISLISLAIM
jgi:hypothetical protein